MIRLALMLSLLLLGSTARAAAPDAGTLSPAELYMRGYQLREANPDEAARLFKQVMAMTPASDENHQKAKSRLTDLERK